LVDQLSNTKHTGTQRSNGHGSEQAEEMTIIATKESLAFAHSLLQVLAWLANLKEQMPSTHGSTPIQPKLEQALP